MAAIAQVALTSKILKDIDLALEDYYIKAIEAGEAMAEHDFKTQVRGLENLIVSTTRFSEVLNYIKNQFGKETNDRKWLTVGPVLLGQLEELETKAKEIAPDDPAVCLEVKLRLLRGWARQVVAHYFYQRRDAN